MTLIALPRTAPVKVAWSLVDAGSTLPGGLGGPDQRVNRLGNRWQVTVDMPPMTADDALAWAVALTMGVEDGVSWRIWQTGTPPGSAGTVRVAGAGQAGRALALDGFYPGFALRMGMCLSILTGGQRYLYRTAAALRADAAGGATAQLTSALRVQPADNDLVEIAAPVIEGLLVDTPGWSIDPDRVARGFSFTIKETR